MRGMRSLLVILTLALAAGPVVRADEPSAEPPAPQATPAVQAVLEEVNRLLGEKTPEQALADAERALAAAARGSDVAGQAHAQRLRARCFEALGRPNDALATWRQAAELWERLGAGPEQIEALGAQALIVGHDDPQGAAAPIDKAASLASEEQARPLAAAAVLNVASESAWRTGRLEIAERFASTGLAITEKRAPGSLDVAASLNNLGNVARDRGDLDAARDYYARVLAIREKLAPGSLTVATSLNNLGLVADDRGNLDAARDYYVRALALREKLAPGSLDVARSLNNLGSVAYARGDLDAAREYNERALAIREKLAPGSLAVAASLGNLGAVAFDRGDLDAARDYQERALAIAEKLAPGSLNVARSLNNLGNVAAARGDLDAARDYYERALAIEEKLAPGSLDVAASLNNLGLVADDRGDLDAARDYYERALAIWEKLAPGSLNVAASLSNLGSVADARGDLEAAREYHERALTIQEKLAPGSLNVAAILNNLGNVACARGNLDAARKHYKRTLAIREKLAPGSLDLAMILKDLGRVARRQADLSGAEQYLARAWSIVRGQRRAVAGDEAGRAFAAKHAGYAADLVGVRLARGQTVAGFQALEEGRAQGLLQLLSERGLGRSAVGPELWRRYEAAERAFQKAGNELAAAGADEARLEGEVAAPAGTGAEKAELQAKQEAFSKVKKGREEALSAYTRARVEKERLLGEVRRSVPGLEPRAFTFEEARRALPKGSVFIAWLVGEEEGSVFVIPADPRQPIAGKKIVLTEAQLDKKIWALRERIGAIDKVRGIGGLAEAQHPAPADAALVRASHELFEVLFPPESREAIEKAQRVIVSPDGPLWELPFAALATRGSGDPRWLGLEKPLSYTPSLTVLALDRERGPSPSSGKLEVLVVGDPVLVRSLKPETAGVAAVAATNASPISVLRGERSYLVSGGSLPPRLPASAEEARRIAALYGAEALLGEAATEAAVRQKISRAAVVHFATHGYFHPHLAMSSGVLLTPPAAEPGSGETDDDGALQAWEFGRTLPLSAELVVLSACETGRGEKVRGEGLVGLTRAIQGAGARSVVATHWKVADESTASLMVTFHEKLQKGLAKDEALRRAMEQTAAKRDTRDPFFWAAFFLTGDPERSLAVARGKGRGGGGATKPRRPD